MEYFGQALEGMLFTQHGWVQSYGSRYVRPPLIVGDIAFTRPMTVDEFQASPQRAPWAGAVRLQKLLGCYCAVCLGCGLGILLLL